MNFQHSFGCRIVRPLLAVCFVAAVAIGATRSAAAEDNDSCRGHFITSALLGKLSFFAQDGKTVVATYNDKTAQYALHIEIKACDDNYFYVVLPNGTPAEVARTDVVTDTVINCAPTTTTDSAVRNGNGAFNGGMGCK